MGDQQDILYEIRDRLVRVETKMDGMTEAKTKAYEAYNKSMKNEEDIREMKDSSKWLWRTVGALVLGLLFEMFKNKL